MTLLNELRANQRLRVGLALIISILALYGLLEWRDFVNAQKDGYKHLALQASRLDSQRSQAQWPQRATEAGVALKEAEASLWRQASLSLAQAELQDWLYAQLRQADAKRYSVKIVDASARLGVAGDDTESTPAAQGLVAMHARLSFDADTPVLLALLAALAEAQHAVAVDSLSLKAKHVEMNVSAWFSASASTAAPAAASAAH